MSRSVFAAAPPRGNMVRTVGPATNTRRLIVLLLVLASCGRSGVRSTDGASDTDVSRPIETRDVASTKDLADALATSPDAPPMASQPMLPDLPPRQRLAHPRTMLTSCPAWLTVETPPPVRRPEMAALAVQAQPLRIRLFAPRPRWPRMTSTRPSAVTYPTASRMTTRQETVICV